MKPIDLLRLIVGNLSRRKARVALTAIGVVIGTAAVVILVSLAIGVQKNFTEQISEISDLSQIQVMPSGEGGGGFGRPIVSQPIGGGNSGTQQLLTTSALNEIRAIPGVNTIIPRDNLYATTMFKYQRLEGWPGGIIGVEINDLSELGLESSQGTTALAKGSIVIGSAVASNFYDPRQRPGQEMPPPPELYNQQIQLIIIKTDKDGNEIHKTLSLRVSGVLTQTLGESDSSVYLPLEQVKLLNEWTNGTRINYARDGYNLVIVKVKDPSVALDIANEIKKKGFQAMSPQEYLQGINNLFIILQVIFGGVGAIALLVAAIGIANTMAMSILERTREIGLMKAVGATNRDVLSIFLGEAAGIGFLGGLGGVVIGWLAAQGMNALAIAFLAGQSGQYGGAPPSVAVFTPILLVVFALIFATLIGMLSGLYPALRAATMIPVDALKYE